MVLTSQVAVAASGTSRATPSALHGGTEAAEILLNVTSAAAALGDTLDVYVQAAVDGASWDDVAHFTQVLGNGGGKKFLARWVALLSPTVALAAPQDAGLAAGSVAQGPHGLLWSVKWVIAGATPVFSFIVSVTPTTARA